MGARPNWYAAVSRGTAILAVLLLSPPPSQAGVTAVEGGGILASLDAASGRYEVRGQESNWVFAGTLGSAASNVGVQDGQDSLGAYRELSFTWNAAAALRGSIRAYRGRPVLLFGVTATEPVADGAAIRFPRFTEFPRNLRTFSYQNSAFAPPSFTLEQNATPWLLYDDHGHAAVLSPATNFMIARMVGDGKAEIASALNAGVGALPAGFSHAMLMVLGVGVNATWDLWGDALIRLQEVHRPGNDADVGLRYLGYWTDHGGEYYYDYDRKLGYAGTLAMLVQRYRDEAIPIRYLQLDSWWYYKTYTDPDGKTGKPKNERLPLEEWNRYGGLMRYEAHPSVFPQGLAAFQQQVGLPLITHNRWIDPASPYRQRYRISGLAAVDPDWWREIIAYLSGADVVTYEQDWLNVIYEESPELLVNPGAGKAFSDGMARAAEEKGLTLQYSMALPRQFLQGSRYSNLTTIRVSGDRFTRDKWDTFLYTSRLASALGIWPWCDVFMSRETDHLLLATLSAGMVGIGDRIGAEDRGNLLHAVRPDGVILKPDSPLTPIDAMYSAGPRRPMIAAAHTDHGALRSSYVFGYSRRPVPVSTAFTPAEVGASGEVYVYDMRHQSARRLTSTEPFSFVLGAKATAYFVVVPVSHSGIALFGDAGRFVPDGRKRIANLVDEEQGLTATITFAAQEKSLRLFGYASQRPNVTAQVGSVDSVSFDRRTGRFELLVSPGSALEFEQPGNDPVRRAILTLRGR
jgi:hypothetical protein